MMKVFMFLFFVLVTNRAGKADVPQKLFLSVYYESKCPDSSSFVLKQLQPALRLLHDRIILKLVPFGKAKSIDGGYSGFACQHGPSECLGNLVQECTLDSMSDRTDTDKVNYVSCEMESFAGSQGSLECVQKSNIPTDVVNECITSGKGTGLQLDSEYLTNLVRPSFVPTVTIDGIFNQQIQDSSVKDLIGTLCSILKDTKECANYYNGLAMNYILL